MIGGDLFQRLFGRFLLVLAVSLLIVVWLSQVYQKKYIFVEWQGIQHESRFYAHNMKSGVSRQDLVQEWKKRENGTRLAFLGPNGKILADSHPEWGNEDVLELMSGKPIDGFAAVDRLPDKGLLVMIRPLDSWYKVLTYELLGYAVLILSLAAFLLYPVVQSLRAAFRGLADQAKEVASGHFGKELKHQRPDELGKLMDAFNDMSRKLAQAERLNTRLIHDVSHELRSPLGRIRVMAETIGYRPAELEACQQGIYGEVDLLDRLVGDLVDAAKMESGATNLTEMSLSSWARKTFARLEKKVVAEGIDWSAKIPENNLRVSADAQRLDQALANLIDNAVNISRDQNDARIECSLIIENKEWRLVVADNGPGIPKANLPHLFRRFYRVEEHRDREGGGVGLGLSIVKAIAEVHGGQASIDSNEGQGTRVTLRFPIQD